MVCLAMAWKVDRAMSARSAPWISRGWMSVLANTPHRPEMLYTVFPRAASCSNASAGTFSRAAISSMKAPVPPAQLPFIRISEAWSFPAASSYWKKITLASWPPSSTAVRTWGYRARTAAALATTSWT